MQPRLTPPPDYTATAKWLHWLVAGLVFAAFALGVAVMNMRHLSVLKVEVFNWHKWLGVLVLVLSILRLGWRLWYPAPPLPNTVASWEQRTSRYMHYLLYVLCFVAAISGYLFTLAVGFPVVLFGWLPLPAPIGTHPEWKEPLRAAHQFSSYALMMAVALHMGATLKHQVWNRDEVLKRILPRSWTR